jgi:hypothetical protein
MHRPVRYILVPRTKQNMYSTVSALFRFKQQTVTVEVKARVRVGRA